MALAPMSGLAIEADLLNQARARLREKDEEAVIVRQ